jgi:hypothetical protein
MTKKDNDNGKEGLTDCHVSTLSANLCNIVQQWQECEQQERHRKG